MKAVYINDNLHRRAKLRAADTGQSLKDLVEAWIEQGLQDTPAIEPPSLLRESAVVYEVAVPVETELSISQPRAGEKETFLADLERRGVLTSGEQMRKQIQAEHLALRKTLGITTTPPAEPPTIEEVRAIFRQQRELHPEVPSLTELLRQMREEE